MNMKRKAVNSLAAHVGSRIKKRRLEKNRSQATLAKNIGTSKSHLSETESGYWRCDFETLWHISKELECDMNYFVEGFE